MAFIVAPAFGQNSPVVTLSASIKAEVEKEVAQAELRLQAHENLSVDDVISVHASGWIYTKEQEAELMQNIAKRGPPPMKVLSARHLDERTIVYAPDLAIVTLILETYYEVPNPEDVAAAAGTLTEDADAMQKAAAPAKPMTEGVAPTPYRVRQTRVWHRENGQWKIILSQGTRIGIRLVPGRQTY